MRFSTSAAWTKAWLNPVRLSISMIRLVSSIQGKRSRICFLSWLVLSGTSSALRGETTNLSFSIRTCLLSGNVASNWDKSWDNSCFLSSMVWLATSETCICWQTSNLSFNHWFLVLPNLMCKTNKYFQLFRSYSSVYFTSQLLVLNFFIQNYLTDFVQ